MNISEANAAQVVLRSLVALREMEIPLNEDVVEAGVFLADRASKALGAGVTGSQLRAILRDGLTSLEPIHCMPEPSGWRNQ